MSAEALVWLCQMLAISALGAALGRYRFEREMAAAVARRIMNARYGKMARLVSLN